jgi:hypothetical protein
MTACTPAVWSWCARPTATAQPVPASSCWPRSASSSNRSTTPSRASWTWSCTAAAAWPGVTVRVAQRLLALTAAIWHNRATGQPVTRSLVVHDH